MKRHSIGIIPGDGIGPGVVAAALEVLEAATDDGPELDITVEEAGADLLSRTGSVISAEALDRIRHKYDVLFKGPVGLPDVRHPDGTESGVLSGILRTTLDAYANVRPVRSLLPAGQRIDYVIVRENTEGLYASRGLGVGNDHVRVDQLLVTRIGVERIVHKAFALASSRAGAPLDGVRRVTCVDKSNVLRSYALFRQIFREVAQQYPDIEAEYCYADAVGHDLVVVPERFDVLVMENLLGDILSDVGAATVGGLGMCPSANIGDRHAYFEPIHGSAPTLAGQNRANPTAQILAGAMMLDHLGEREAARMISFAVADAYSSGKITIQPDGCPSGGTLAVAKAVIHAMTTR